MAGASDRPADPFWASDNRCCGRPMVITTRFGRKLKLPSTVQIKRELLLRWLADQEGKEAAEVSEKARTATAKDSATDVTEQTDHGKPNVQG
jgi:hypothetical protein